MSLTEKLQSHWLTAVVGVAVASSATTWIALENTRIKSMEGNLKAMEETVKAKDAQIEFHKATIAELKEKRRDIPSAAPTTAAVSQPLSTAAPVVSTSNPMQALVPTWLEEGKPLQVLENRAQVVISYARPSVQTVVINMELPTGSAHFGVTTPSTPRPFSIGTQSYVLRVIEIADSKAKVSITRAQ